MSELVDGVTSSIDELFIHIKNQHGKMKIAMTMPLPGFSPVPLKLILSKVNMVTLSSKIERTAVENDAHGMIYVLSGKVTGTLSVAKVVSLSQGDTLYFAMAVVRILW